MRIRWAVVAIGVGASALATAPFTFTFQISSRNGDFTTPVVVQHLQPLMAISLAVVVLMERLRLRTAALIVAGTGDSFWVPGLSASFSLLCLGLVPSLLALTVYSPGLRRTAVSRATLAELALPLTGAVIGTIIGNPQTIGQWIGGVVVAGSVTALCLARSYGADPSRHLVRAGHRSCRSRLMP